MGLTSRNRVAFWSCVMERFLFLSIFTGLITLLFLGILHLMGISVTVGMIVGWAFGVGIMVLALLS